MTLRWPLGERRSRSRTGSRARGGVCAPVSKRPEQTDKSARFKSGERKGRREERKWGREDERKITEKSRRIDLRAEPWGWREGKPMSSQHTKKRDGV